jgi:hypothetical protein
MTTQHEPDSIIAAWLEEGPTTLPSTTRRAILTALPPIPQARRGPFTPWRNLTLKRLSAKLLIVLVVAAGAAAAYLIRQPELGAVGDAPSLMSVFSTPSPEPSAASETIDRSVEDGYLVTIPASWNYSVVPNGLFFSAAPPITAATLFVGRSVAGETPGMYVIRESGGSTGTITVVTVTGHTVDELLGSVNESFIVNMSAEATGEREVTIDGEPGWVTEHATTQPANLWIDVVVIHGDRAYNLSVDAPPDNAEVLRATFDEIVSSIRWTE